MLSAKTKTRNASTAATTTMTPVTFTEGEEDMKQQQQLQELQTKIDDTTNGFTDYYRALLKRQSEENILTIVEYIASMNVEINLSVLYRREQLAVLCYLSEFHHQKSFKDMTREDIIGYLNSLRKTEEAGPLHKWIGTYNLRRICLLRFFKWLYYPDMQPSKRLTPEIVMNIQSFKRKERSIYKPTDLWTQEDDVLFLKYCPNKRDICYHAISRDLSCRPHEILNLRIKDINFKTTADNYQYAEVLVNGKTGSRPIPLISSIPYVKDWLDLHPQRGNPNAFLIPSFDR